MSSDYSCSYYWYIRNTIDFVFVLCISTLLDSIIWKRFLKIICVDLLGKQSHWSLVTIPLTLPNCCRSCQFPWSIHNCAKGKWWYSFPWMRLILIDLIMAMALGLRLWLCVLFYSWDFFVLDYMRQALPIWPGWPGTPSTLASDSCMLGL
jgi:hypothetical protein